MLSLLSALCLSQPGEKAHRQLDHENPQPRFFQNEWNDQQIQRQIPEGSNRPQRFNSRVVQNLQVNRDKRESN